VLVERGDEFFAVVDELADDAEETAGAGGLVRLGRCGGGGGWGGGGGLGGHERIEDIK
jgi:hypothetical protein